MVHDAGTAGCYIILIITNYILFVSAQYHVVLKSRTYIVHARARKRMRVDTRACICTNDRRTQAREHFSFWTASMVTQAATVSLRPAATLPGGGLQCTCAEV